jgi:tRNA(Ile)-lysidine synthetase-like protein
MEYVNKLLSTIKEGYAGLELLSDKPILLMVSGGTDSALLPELFVMANLGVPLHVFHVNYGLRGADSDADEEQVVASCNKLGLDHTVHKVSNMSRRNMEKEARDIRYGFVKKNFDEYVKVTAHHMEDQIETVIMRLARGCSIYGYSGIDELRKDLVWRPFLKTQKSIITVATSELGIVPRTDATNYDENITRNWIRHSYIPNNVDDNCSRSLLELSESCKLLRDVVDKILVPVLKNIAISSGSITIKYKNIDRCILEDAPISKRLRDRVWNMAELKPPNDEQYEAVISAIHKRKKGSLSLGKQVASWADGVLEIR